MAVVLVERARERLAIIGNLKTLKNFVSIGSRVERRSSVNVLSSTVEIGAAGSNVSVLAHRRV